MDVTFVETQSYFDSNLSGGNYTKEDSIIDQEKTRNIQHRDSKNGKLTNGRKKSGNGRGTQSGDCRTFQNNDDIEKKKL